MTKLSCRARDPKLRVAYILDAYFYKAGKPFHASIEPGQEPYQEMWGILGRAYKRLGWDEFCDPEIDDLWKTAITVGLKVFYIELTPQDVLSAKQRWHKSLWYRHEYKRSIRNATVAPWLKLVAIV